MFRTLHKPDQSVTIHIDGAAVAAQPGETVAAVMLRQPEIWTRQSPISGARRAPYCMMGVCFECLAHVDEAGSVQTCLTIVRDGMRVRRQRGRPDITEQEYAE